MDDSEHAVSQLDITAFLCPYCGECTVEQFYSEEGCPQKAATDLEKCHVLFPYLDMSGLDEDTQVNLQYRLISEAQSIIACFASFKTYVMTSLEHWGIPIDKIKHSILSLEAFTHDIGVKLLEEKDKQEIRAAETIPAVFIVLCNYTSFLNYHIIEYIVIQHGTAKDREKLEEYLEQLHTFCQRNIFEVPRGIFSSNSLQSTKVFALKCNEEVATVNGVLGVRGKIAEVFGLQPAALQLCSVRKGCVELRFLISAEIADHIFPISSSQHSALCEIRVRVLSCDSVDKTFIDKAESFTPSAPLDVSAGALVATEKKYIKHVLQLREFILQEICEYLTPKDVRHIAYTQKLPSSRDGLSLFLKLEVLDKFSESNVAPLSHMLKVIGRKDLAKKVEKYTKKQKIMKILIESLLQMQLKIAQHQVSILLEDMKDVQTKAREIDFREVEDCATDVVMLITNQLQHKLSLISNVLNLQQASSMLKYSHSISSSLTNDEEWEPSVALPNRQNRSWLDAMSQFLARPKDLTTKQSKGRDPCYPSFTFREMIFQEICEHLTPKDVMHLACSQNLPAHYLHKDGTEILRKLEVLEKFSEFNLEPLAHMMKVIGRKDLAKRVEKCCTKLIKQMQQKPTKKATLINENVHKQCQVADHLQMGKLQTKMLLEQIENMLNTARDLGHKKLDDMLNDIRTIIEQQFQEELRHISDVFSMQEAITVNIGDMVEESSQHSSLTINKSCDGIVSDTTSKQNSCRSPLSDKMTDQLQSQATKHEPDYESVENVPIPQETMRLPHTAAASLYYESKEIVLTQSSQKERLMLPTTDYTEDSADTSTGDSGFVDSRKYRKYWPPPKVSLQGEYTCLNTDQRESTTVYTTPTKKHIDEYEYAELASLEILRLSPTPLETSRPLLTLLEMARPPPAYLKTARPLSTPLETSVRPPPTHPKTARPLSTSLETSVRPLPTQIDSLYHESKKIVSQSRPHKSQEKLVMDRSETTQPKRKPKIASKPTNLKRQVTSKNSPTNSPTVPAPTADYRRGSADSSTGESCFVQSRKYRKDCSPPEVIHRYKYMPLNAEQKETTAHYIATNPTPAKGLSQCIAACSGESDMICADVVCDDGELVQ